MNINNSKFQNQQNYTQNTRASKIKTKRPLQCKRGKHRDQRWHHNLHGSETSTPHLPQAQTPPSLSSQLPILTLTLTLAPLLHPYLLQKSSKNIQQNTKIKPSNLNLRIENPSSQSKSHSLFDPFLRIKNPPKPITPASNLKNSTRSRAPVEITALNFTKNNLLQNWKHNLR